MMYCETDSAFYAYYQWCEDQLSRWEYEQELADTYPDTDTDTDTEELY